MPRDVRHPPRPLVVDVDGSLVAGDLAVEGLARLLSVSPLSLFRLPFWLAALPWKGRAGLKRRIAEAVPLPPETLVLNTAVLSETAAAKAAGREVWLASASDARVVDPFVEAVGAADRLASDGRTNQAGEAKAAALVERFGKGGFDYIGNERRAFSGWPQRCSISRHVRCGFFAGHASRERSWARRSQDAVPAQVAPWGEIHQQPPRTEPESRKNAVSAGAKNISTIDLYLLYQKLKNSARGSFQKGCNPIGLVCGSRW